MVKNLTGGTKTKGLARKHQNKSTSASVRLPQCEEEQFAYVSKALGNGMCEVFINENQRLIAHIRNKFRGRQKRHNMISSQMIVLVGLRTWESTLKNCDILYVYDDNEINQLKNRPDIGFENVVKLQNANTIIKSEIIDEDTLLFNDESDTITNNIVVQEDIHYETFETNNEIDIDDI
jgi:initiation factor 1A